MNVPVTLGRAACAWLLPCLLAAAPAAMAEPERTANAGFDYGVLHSFTLEADGKRAPRRLASGVVLARDGWLYGMSSAGGLGDHGTSFRVWPATGEAQVLHRFGKVAADGIYPQGPLIEEGDGHFIGATALGGAHGKGTVFRMHPDGFVRVLHDFKPGDDDGAYPSGPPILAGDGWRYGVTGGGGAHDHGTVYRLGPAGEFELLYSFGGQYRGDGDEPVAPLVQAPDGRFYGVTREGGTHGRGTLFRIAAEGGYEKLHDFVNGPRGTHPIQPLMLASDGQLYGSTLYSGDFGWGTLFRVGPDGRPVTLHSVESMLDGVRVSGALAEGADGLLYYPMAFGPKPTQGAVMRLDPASGGVEVLHQIMQGDDGSEVLGTLAIAADGRLFGGTYLSQDAQGGNTGGGLVFSLTPRKPAVSNP